MAGFRRDTKPSFIAIAGQNPQLEVNHMCGAADFRAFCLGKFALITYGDILPTSTSSEAVNGVVELLVLHGASGGVVLHSNFTMVIYPSHTEQWRFLHQESELIAGTKLRFVVMAALPVPTPMVPAALGTVDKANTTNIETAVNAVLGIEINRLFTSFRGAVGRNVFLMFPPQSEEAELLIRFFHTIGAKVYSSSIPGSWHYMLNAHNKAGGVIVLHSGVCNYWQIPDLSMFLNLKFNFFQLAYKTSSLSSDSDQRKYTCTTLFPHGYAMYITDSVFAYEPPKARLLIDNFNREFGSKPSKAMETSKLAGRPGLKNWLLQLAVEHSEEDRKAKDDTRIKLYLAMDTIAPPSATDPNDPSNPLPEARLVSIPPSTLSKHAQLWKDDEQKANDYIVNWFAGWACTQVTNFRRFFVIHTEVETNWKRKYAHLQVMTTDGYFDKFVRK
ncbi:hypothetical protein BJ546DRAFT_118264 [Cryomyces antarcticus]